MPLFSPWLNFRVPDLEAVGSSFSLRLLKKSDIGWPSPLIMPGYKTEEDGVNWMWNSLASMHACVVKLRVEKICDWLPLATHMMKQWVDLLWCSQINMCDLGRQTCQGRKLVWIDLIAVRLEWKNRNEQVFHWLRECLKTCYLYCLFSEKRRVGPRG